VLPRRFILWVLVPSLITVAGTLGYWLIEPQYSLFDALYMTVITITTVGYGEVHPLGPAGKAFTIVLLLGGGAAFLYAATEVVRTVVSGELRQTIEKKRMERNLAELNNHTIICGYGRMGRHVCHEFSKQKLPFVIIDRRAEALQDFKVPYGIAVVGDATSDEVLLRAGVDRAEALVTVAASDADNLYITMSARLLNEKLVIVARAEGEQAEKKLRRAGATRVVTPYAIGGAKVALAVLRPNVVDFIELATKTEHLELQIEEALIGADSPLIGTPLSASRLDGSMVYTPPPEAVIGAGDMLIALGRRDQLDQFEKLAGARPRRPG
jgi:voltage-gated potassium channel